MSGQFSGTPLVAGEVYGVRAWDVDELGRMKSPTYSHVWTPGENIATCKKRSCGGALGGFSSVSFAAAMRAAGESLERAFFVGSDGGIYRAPKTGNLTAATIYFADNFTEPTVEDISYDPEGDRYVFEWLKKGDPDAPWWSPRRRARTEKAVRAADVVENWAAEKEARERAEKEAEIARREALKPPPPPHDMASCSCGFYAYTSGANDYSDRHVIGVVQGYGKTSLGTRGFRTEKAKVVAAYVRPSSVKKGRNVRPLPVSLARMQELYPDVRFFTDYEAMIAEFPPSDPEVTPATDPDFWNRQA